MDSQAINSGDRFFRVNLLSWLTTKSNYQKALITRRFSTRSRNILGMASRNTIAAVAAPWRRRFVRLSSDYDLDTINLELLQQNIALEGGKITFHVRLATNIIVNGNGVERRRKSGVISAT